jgi:hypothetical protein
MALIILVESTKYEALHCAISSMLLLLPSSVQTSSAFYTQDTLNLCSLRANGEASLQYRIVGKIIASLVLIFRFLDSGKKVKLLLAEWYQAFREFNLLLISPSM